MGAVPGNGNPFTEDTATEWANTLNDERESVCRAFGAPEQRPCIVAAVVPVMSPELMAAIVNDGQHTQAMIETGKDKS